MTVVEIDDDLYVEAQTEFDRWEIARRRGGTGEVFMEYLPKVGVEDHAEKGKCNEALAELLGHAKGRYSSVGAMYNERGRDLRLIVWSFHRAWVDRYGWSHSMPDAD
jgi:hypothetical protein